MPPSASAMDFFQLFVPDNVLKNMVVQTNLYAKKFQERFGSDGAWADVTLPEMKAFLGYVISTSTSHCESVLSIWSGGFYSNRSLALVMSQARFEKILKYFHVVAFRSSQTTHGLYKVQPFLDSLQSGFDSAFRPSQTQEGGKEEKPRRPGATADPLALVKRLMTYKFEQILCCVPRTPPQGCQWCQELSSLSQPCRLFPALLFCFGRGGQALLQEQRQTLSSWSSRVQSTQEDVGLASRPRLTALPGCSARPKA
ncbi:hypothetical protein Celaphus_00008109 [Cervus elaphus hippelaphus]|uniref:PiggyBac transposable element-derived protein domain-containing protein n=1 Tax=Cervus elaphus hippelaphus TaxID=46360 RepID=A0A212CNX4_CEREH|nr:hypothetical protein Celaphus_00008109 [Cervus elaphus hippelaphus]